jgi:hypothetical protein
MKMKKQRPWSKEAIQRHKEGVERYQEHRREGKKIENTTELIWRVAENIEETPDDVLRGIVYLFERNEEIGDGQAFKAQISTMKELMKRGEIKDPIFTTSSAAA